MTKKVRPGRNSTVAAKTAPEISGAAKSARLLATPTIPRTTPARRPWRETDEKSQDGAEGNVY